MIHAPHFLILSVTTFPDKHSTLTFLLHFYTANRQILISSLRELRVSGSALSIISHLNNCAYRLTWRRSVSEPCPLTIVSSKAQSFFSSLCTTTVSALSITHMASPTMLMLMPVFFPIRDSYQHRSNPCLFDCGWLHTTRKCTRHRHPTSAAHPECGNSTGP